MIRRLWCGETMRILLLNFEKGWRGGERQTLLSLQQFRTAGHDVALLARRGAELARAALQEGIVVYEEDSVAGVCRVLWRQRAAFDVYHAQTAGMMTWLAVLKPILHGVTVFTRRTAFPVRRRPAITAWKWRRADVLVAITQAAGAEPRRLGLQVHHVIPSAVEYRDADPEAIAAMRQQYRLNGGRRVIATAAALTREKDPLTLIDAVHQLHQWRDDFVFLHFGAMGPMEAPARQRVQELGLQEHYIFAGFHANISDGYRLMDVFVLSSLEEALGSVVLDAFLYRVPVVSTTAGGLAEVLAGGRGIGCSPGDSRCLAQGMQRMLDDTASRDSMVDRAHDYVVHEHGVAHMAQCYLRAYAEAGAPAGGA